MLRYLFIDMNSFFASVEQQEIPKLRDKPVGVVPVLAWNSCCIAASYEAKAYGVKTGTSLAEARRLCPSIHFVTARPKTYVEYHHKIITSIERCIHIEKVCSIDEMYGKLYNNERDIPTVISIALRIKEALFHECGRYIRCSIGIAPNIWLAKTATNLKKPDGLTIIQQDEIQQKICSLQLEDLTGISRGMSRRLRSRGIRKISQLFELSERQLSLIWGSKIHGKRWWHKLRGFDIREKETTRRSVSHSHVLPPHYRNTSDAFGVGVRMMHKAGYRLRKINYHTTCISCIVKLSTTQQAKYHPAYRTYPPLDKNYLKREEFAQSLMTNSLLQKKHTSRASFIRSVTCHPIRDTTTLIGILKILWRDLFLLKKQVKPIKVTIVLSKLLPDSAISLSLFPEKKRLSQISDTLDRINNRYGANTLYLASMHGYHFSAPERISFTQIPDLKAFVPLKE